MGGILIALWSFLRRWRWAFLGVLVLSLVIMIVEVAISRYTPPLDDPWDILMVVVGGTVYIWWNLIVLFVLPIVLLVDLTRWWKRKREKKVSNTNS